MLVVTCWVEVFCCDFGGLVWIGVASVLVAMAWWFWLCVAGWVGVDDWWFVAVNSVDVSGSLCLCFVVYL